MTHKPVKPAMCLGILKQQFEYNLLNCCLLVWRLVCFSKKKKKGLESHFCLSLLFQFSEFTTHSFWKTHMHEWWIASHKALVDQKCKTVKSAFAGSRTRVYCLEGNYPNRWTTNARWCLRVSSILLLSLHILTVFPILPSSFFFFFLIFNFLSFKYFSDIFSLARKSWSTWEAAWNYAPLIYW